MSADLLRRAAKTLREHAELATPGKWLSLDAGDRLIAVQPDDDFEYLVTEEPARHGETADYIALMHPPVALALASVFDRFAWLGDRDPDLLRRVGCDEVIATAREILREES